MMKELTKERLDFMLNGKADKSEVRKMEVYLRDIGCMFLKHKEGWEAYLPKSTKIDYKKLTTENDLLVKDFKVEEKFGKIMITAYDGFWWLNPFVEVIFDAVNGAE